MVSTSFDRGAPVQDNKPDQGKEGAQNAIAQALTGKVFMSEIQKNFGASMAHGGSVALETAIGGQKDMMAENHKLEEEGKLPEQQRVLDAQQANKDDRSANIAVMMTSEKPSADAALDNTLKNV